MSNKMSVFVSCQLTPAILKSLKFMHRQLMADFYMSAPPFNLYTSKDVSEEEDKLAAATMLELKDKMNMINQPCYGVDIPKQIQEQFNRDDAKELKAMLLEVSPKFLDVVIDKVPSSFNKMKTVANALTDQYQKANVLAFITAFENVKDDQIKSFQDWETFVKSFIMPEFHHNWTTMLHYDDVLKLFGCTTEDIQQLREVEQKNDKGETIKWEDYIRWISKALSAYKIYGCLVDFVNLMYAMAGKDDIPEFITRVLNRDPSLRQMTSIFMDFETDDILATIICKYINPKTSVFAQLPMSFGPYWNMANVVLNAHTTFILDPHTRNENKVKPNYDSVIRLIAR